MSDVTVSRVSQTKTKSITTEVIKVTQRLKVTLSIQKHKIEPLDQLA